MYGLACMYVNVDKLQLQLYKHIQCLQYKHTSRIHRNGGGKSVLGVCVCLHKINAFNYRQLIIMTIKQAKYLLGLF